MKMIWENKTSYTTQYEEVHQQYVANEYCTKHARLPVIKPTSISSNNRFPSPRAQWFAQSSLNPYDLSSDDEEDLTPQKMAGMKPGRSYRAAYLWTATRLYLNSPPETPTNWGQVNLNVNDDHSNPIEISSRFQIPDITDWLRHPEETPSWCADLPNVAHDIVSIIPHGGGLEANFSLARDVIGWEQSQTIGETLFEKVVARLFARGNNGVLTGNDPALDRTNTDNNLEMKREVDECNLHR